MQTYIDNCALRAGKACWKQTQLLRAWVELTSQSDKSWRIIAPDSQLLKRDLEVTCNAITLLYQEAVERNQLQMRRRK